MRYSARLAMRTSFGRLVSDLSTRFTGLPVEEVDGEIERALRLFVELLGTDRSTFFLIDPGRPPGPDPLLGSGRRRALVAVDHCRGAVVQRAGWRAAT